MNAISAILKSTTSRFASIVLTLAAAALLSPAPGLAAAKATLQIVSGADQQTTYSAEFPSPLVVRVSDAITKRPIPGVAVRFTAGSGISLSATQATTDRFGLAIIKATGVAVGHSSVSVEIPRVPNVQATFDGLAVHKALITVIPADLAANVGNVPAITQYSFQGLVNGETVQSAHITGDPVLTTAATNHSPDANYAIKGGPGTLRSLNYDFVPGFGTLVLVGSLKSDSAEAENTTLYDEKGMPSTLPGANEAANAVRKAFLDQSTSAPASFLSKAQVQAAREFHLAVRSTSSATAGEVKAIQTLHRSDTAASRATPADANAVQTAFTSQVGKLVQLPMTPAGNNSANSVAAVRAATELTTPASLATLKTSYTTSPIRSAFPPPSH